MEGLVGAQMTAGAFNAIPVIGPAVLTFGLLTFAWSTILGWSYYGERCWGMPYKRSVRQQRSKLHPVQLHSLPVQQMSKQHGKA